MILEGDIVQFLEGGEQYSTSDIYKSLGGKKSKDVRVQLDNLYKQGTVERTKVSNSYFWKLRRDDVEQLKAKKSRATNLDNDIYNQLVQQLRDEIRFLRGTVSDLLKSRQSEIFNMNTNNENIQQNTNREVPSTNMIFPTETPIIVQTKAASSQSAPPPPPPPIQPTVIVNTDFETPRRTTSPRQAPSFSIPLNNRYEHLYHDTIVSNTSTQPSQSAHTLMSSQTTQVTTSASRPGNVPPAQPQTIGPFVNRNPDNDYLATNLAAQRNKNAVTRKTKAVLLGDSNFNRILVPELNTLLTKSSADKFAYSGATSVHLYHYCDVLLAGKPDSVLIHGGTNDIWGRNRRNVSSQQIAKDIISIGVKCRERGVKNVYISAIIVTHVPHSNRSGREINALLKLLCVDNNFTYIDNDFLTEEDLEDQVHLSWDGRRKLVNNYIAILDG